MGAKHSKSQVKNILIELTKKICSVQSTFAYLNVKQKVPETIHLVFAIQV